jgi:uncharacterized protein with PIN domain
LKFVADVMLGSLVKLMRFRGYEVEYSNRASDEELRKRSRYRLLLTKDRDLSKQIRDGHVYLVQSVGAQKQMDEIELRFPPGNFSPRCLECNSKLRSVRKQMVEHLVPPYVYQNNQKFMRCPSCTRIYWTGTHFRDLTQRRQDAKWSK